MWVTFHFLEKHLIMSQVLPTLRHFTSITSLLSNLFVVCFFLLLERYYFSPLHSIIICGHDSDILLHIALVKIVVCWILLSILVSDWLMVWLNSSLPWWGLMFFIPCSIIAHLSRVFFIVWSVDVKIFFFNIVYYYNKWIWWKQINLTANHTTSMAVILRCTHLRKRK